MRTRVKRGYSGTTSQCVSDRELRNRAVARSAAADGIVLLKNDGVLPLKQGERVALFGGGAVKTIKGGSGSGDVNERESVSIYQGFLDAGIQLSNKKWLDSFAQTYKKAREDWKAIIVEETAQSASKRLLDSYNRHRFQMPTGDAIEESDFDGVKTGFYVISRTAGESADRFLKPGDYYLTQSEKEQLWIIAQYCENLVVIINAGAQIDLAEIIEIPNLKGLLYISQPGMEGGHAVADVVTGKITPSGKLTDTWAANYEDYPNAATFSHNNGDLSCEYYTEGRYVGYRYFDSFEKSPVYSFGFGLSYTSFSITVKKVETDENCVRITVNVCNTGTHFSGREVIQVYASCPQQGISKERRRLVGFAKTKPLNPCDSQQLFVEFGAKDIASFDEEHAAWIIQEGGYGIWVGNSLLAAQLRAVLRVHETTCLEKVAHICPVSESLPELECPQYLRFTQETEWHRSACEKNLFNVDFSPTPESSKPLRESNYTRMAAEITNKLDEEQLISMVVGEIAVEYDQTIGAAGIRVPGSAGETSHILEKDFHIPSVVMADGPAGVRLAKTYEVDSTDGKIINPGILGALEGGFFADIHESDDAIQYHQYCTAFPVGTLLAQTWDVELLEIVGNAVGEELQEFGISWWLAPGMNIHRNPLCGRNFEYFSEDPVISGKMAAAITRGVQSVPGVGTTIKHFACNNQEDNRRYSNSIVTERTLREIYLRGFEIAVKESQPMAIMTSYNLINGVHAANSHDLCSRVLRDEWGYHGIIMTDWSTTRSGQSVPWMCISAGNDLIMPGCPNDVDSIRAALSDGRLDKEALRSCVRRLIAIILQTLEFEDVLPYAMQFHD